MKILNLYAGIGGNRKLWGDDHEIVAVEHDPKIAAIYADLWPNDELIVGDAHEYLRLHHHEFGFIWSSPPCQSHSSMRYNIQVKYRGAEEKYADMTLYEEILFLQYHSEALWVVENVVPYYNGGQPLIPARKINRHLYWANFELPARFEKRHENLRSIQVDDLEQLHGFDLSAYELPNKRQVLRNVVDPQIGLQILEAALGVEPVVEFAQLELF